MPSGGLEFLLRGTVWCCLSGVHLFCPPCRPMGRDSMSQLSPLWPFVLVIVLCTVCGPQASMCLAAEQEGLLVPWWLVTQQRPKQQSLGTTGFWRVCPLGSGQKGPEWCCAPGFLALFLLGPQKAAWPGRKSPPVPRMDPHPALLVSTYSQHCPCLALFLQGLG